MNFTIAGIALAVAAAVGAWAGHSFTSAHYLHLIDVQAREAQSRVDAANRTALNAAAGYEGWKATQRPKTITITREVQSALKADPDCSQRALPASVRDALTRAATEPDQPVPDGAMPAASGAFPFNLGGFGFRIRGTSR